MGLLPCVLGPPKLPTSPGHMASLDSTPAILDGLGCGPSPLPGPTGPLRPFPALLPVLEGAGTRGGWRRPGSSQGSRDLGQLCLTCSVADPSPSWVEIVPPWGCWTQQWSFCKATQCIWGTLYFTPHTVSFHHTMYLDHTMYLHTPGSHSQGGQKPQGGRGGPVLFLGTAQWEPGVG